mgnify:CR=1 FL=1
MNTRHAIKAGSIAQSHATEEIRRLRNEIDQLKGVILVKDKRIDILREQIAKDRSQFDREGVDA